LVRCLLMDACGKWRAEGPREIAGKGTRDKAGRRRA